MNQQQINEFILEALVSTEIDTNRGICDLLVRKTKQYNNGVYKYLEVKDTFKEALVTACKMVGCFSGSTVFPIVGDWTNTIDKWDIDTEYGKYRHQVYDALVKYFEYETGIL